MTAGLRFFYRHIHITGLENIPSKGPVIIIANHNSSLMDAALLGILLQRRAWFFARGDVFINKPVQTILRWLHMMPVHGHQGGRNTLGANSNSFSAGQQILLKGGIIVFFPESTSHIEHQLLPFRKGVFRLAFDTARAHQFSFDIPIVPVGITYEHPVACRTTAEVHVGKPIFLSDYKNEYKESPSVALLHICKDAHYAVGKLVLHIVDRQRLQMANQYFVINRNDNPVINTAWKIVSGEKLEREKNICSAINNAVVPEFEAKQKKANNYFDILSAEGIADKAVSSTFSFASWKKILLWIGFPVYVVGLLLNGLPILLARLVADKKVYRQDFYSWIFVVCYSFMYFFWLLILIITCFAFGWQYTIVLIAAMILTGIFAYVYRGWLKEYTQHKKWQSLAGNRANELKLMRSSL